MAPPCGDGHRARCLDARATGLVGGQLLLTLDSVPADLAARRAHAEANASRAEAAGAEALAEVAQRRAQQSRRGAIRAERLLRAGLATQEALDTARHAAVVDGLEAEASNERSATAAKQAAAAARLADLAARAAAATVERAPHDGVIAQVLVRPGEWVHAGAAHVAPAGLVALDSTGPSDVEVRLPQRDAVRLRPGWPARVVIQALSSSPWSAHVVAIGDGAEGTAPVRVRLDRLPPNARKGLSASVHLAVASKARALAVPNHALLDLSRISVARWACGPTDARQGAWTIRNGRMALVPLTLGLRGDVYTEVLAGLTLGELVVTGPVALVRGMGIGDRVIPMPTSMRAPPL